MFEPTTSHEHQIARLEERIETLTRDQEHLLSAIVQSSDDAIIAKDLDGTILSWNRGAERIYGYRAEEVIGRSVSLLIPSDHPEQLAEIMGRLRVGERIEHYVTERVRKDGQRITISLTVSPIMDQYGMVAGASSIARDITERIESEEAMRRSEERLREAQRLANLGSWELDLANNALLWSDEIYRIFEIDPVQFGASYEAFLAAVHPDDRAAVDAAYTASVRDRTPYSIDHRILLPDGRIKHVREQCRTYYDASGQPLRSMGTVQDITEQKLIEAEIRELNLGLEHRVLERTNELRESQRALMNIVEDLNLKTAELEAANARLQELEQLKSMFIASMSHELRTPLNSIIGFSSILHDEWLGPVNPEQKENLATILRSGKHLLNLINDVIDVSKIEAGKIQVSVQEFDLHDLMVEAVQLVEKEVRGKGLELHLELRHQTLCTDRRRLLQCVINLLSNALKFTEQGGIEVETSAGIDTAGSRPKAMPVTIAVRDTGIGIAEEDIRRLFQPFVRLDSPLKTTVPGTGLGLYLTRKLIGEVLHGEILCTSRIGAGSCFTIRIPERIDEKGTGNRG